MTLICYTGRRYAWMVLYAIPAVVFNPFLPLYLGRELWQLVDMVFGLFLLISLVAFRVREDRPDTKGRVPGSSEGWHPA
jgi:hypothetical protein